MGHEGIDELILSLHERALQFSELLKLEEDFLVCNQVVFNYNQWNSKWIQSIPSHWLIFYQTFRIGIETLFIFSIAKEIVHPNATIEGYNYDILFASTAPIIRFLFYRNKTAYRKLALAWNYSGLVVIVLILFIVQTTIFAPQIYGDIALFPNEFIDYPYILVASFLMPTAVFMHVLSIVQLKRSKN